MSHAAFWAILFQEKLLFNKQTNKQTTWCFKEKLVPCRREEGKQTLFRVQSYLISLKLLDVQKGCKNLQRLNEFTSDLECILKLNFWNLFLLSHQHQFVQFQEYIDMGKIPWLQNWQLDINKELNYRLIQMNEKIKQEGASNIWFEKHRIRIYDQWK